MELNYLNDRLSRIQSKDVYNLAGPYLKYVYKLYNLSCLDRLYDDLLEEILYLLLKYVKLEKRKKNNVDTSFELQHFINFYVQMNVIIE